VAARFWIASGVVAAAGLLAACAVVPEQAPQWRNVPSGEGWRLVANGQSRTDAYTVRAATEEGEFAEMWRVIGLGGEPPEVDFDDEVAVSFGHGIGSSCPEVRLDAIVIGEGVVHSVVSDPITDPFGSPRACTADLVGAAVFVVAVQRSVVGDESFTLQLSERTVCGGDACGFPEKVVVQQP